MKYYLKQAINGKVGTYYKIINYFDRNIGKSVALARLSAKYNIPVIVPTQLCKNLIEVNIPRYMPKYFKKKHPIAIIANENFKKRYDILLVEEGFGSYYLDRISPMAKHFVGYVNK